MQTEIIYWAGLVSMTCPELALIYHVPNEGKRSPQYGSMMKKAGLKSGVPDLFLPVAKKKFHGLYIELKDGHKKPTKNQLWWLEHLAKQGYRCLVCESFGAAVAAISDYMDIPSGVPITDDDLAGIIEIE